MDTRSEDRDFLRYRDGGSTDALARVFDAVAPRLLLLAAHLTPDAAQAEDLVQTTFLHGMRDAARYDGQRSVAAWLAGILNHRALDLRRRSILRAHEPLGESAVDGLDPAELVADQEFTERIVSEIGAIESPYREVLSLRVVRGLEPTAIAHSLGRAPGTVRMQLKRGLERLRAALPEQSAFLGVFFFESGRGLDVVRETVLEKANTGAAVAAGTSGVVGGFVIMKIAVATIVAVVVSIALFRMSGGPNEPLETTVAARDATVEGTGQGASSADESLAAVTVADRAAVIPVADGDRSEAPAAGFVVRVVYESDGAPAVDVGVYVRGVDAEGLGREARTDAHGRAAFVGLNSGWYMLHVDRLRDPIPFDGALPGPFDVLIPSGARVDGTVVDLDGNAVAGAQILRLNEQHHDRLQVVATSDDEGRFAFRDVVGGTEFLARVEGFQPSKLRAAWGRSAGAETLGLKLVMGARGHLLEGRVIDVEGHPVPFAWVALGVDEDSRDQMRGSDQRPAEKGGGKAMDLEGILLRADGAGRFESREVPAGYVLVIARPAAATSDLIGSETLWIRYGDDAKITVRLRRGAVVEGVLKDTDGHPVAGHLLEAEWEGTPMLGQMEDDIGPFMTDRRCVSADDGSFRLAGLLAGDYDLRVMGHRAKRSRGDRLIGESENVHWDPVIEPPAVLTLRLVDSVGEPLVGWAVHPMKGSAAYGTARFWGAFLVTTDDQGRRRFSKLERDSSYSIAIYAPDVTGVFNRLRAAVRTGVVPSGEELEIRLTPEETEFGGVSGRWNDVAGRPQRDRLISLRSVDGEHRTSTRTGDDGEFVFEAVPAGAYRLTTNAGQQELVEIRLAAGEDHRTAELRSD